MAPFFSLIIPAYNSEKYISTCIKSVLSQNYSAKKYEIIIVNDGSKDGTLSICNKFRKKNKAIKILNNNRNFGVSNSRNLGIKYASGRYIIFLDSDDELKCASLSSLETLLIRNKVDLLLALQPKKKDKYNYLNRLNKKNKILKTKEKLIFFKLLNSNPNFKAHCWNYILKRDFLKKNKIYFKKIRVFEDQVFISEILCYVKKFKVINGTFHIHHERFNSLGRSMKKTTLLSCLKVINDICVMIKKDGLSFEQRKFLQGRIRFMLGFLKLYLLFFNKKQTKTVCFFIKKNITNFLVIKQKSFSKILNKKNFNYIFKKILRFKDNAELLFRNFNIKKSSLVYVFGAGLLGRVTRQILKKSNVNTVAFLDNNEYFHNKKCLDLKIIKPELLSRFNANQLMNLQVIVSEEGVVSVNKIFNQLRIYGLKEDNIKIVNWKKILSWT